MCCFHLLTLNIKAGEILRRPEDWPSLGDRLSSDARKALREEKRGFWSQAKPFRVTIIALAVAAIVQGWTQVSRFQKISNDSHIDSGLIDNQQWRESKLASSYRARQLQGLCSDHFRRLEVRPRERCTLSGGKLDVRTPLRHKIETDMRCSGCWFSDPLRLVAPLALV